MIWFKEYSINEVNQLGKGNLLEHLEIEITELGEDFIKGSMPINSNVKQPFGILHGGINCVLAETLGSIGSNLILNNESEHAVGTSISTNHVKAVRNGRLTAIATLSHKGRTTHTWNIKTFNDNNDLTSETIFSVMVISKL